VREMLSKSAYRRGLAAICVLLIALLVVRPQAERVRWRVSQSISLAVGKRVQIGALHVRFLPHLGFELEDFVIYDDAEFGSEPLLRAEDVTASLRFLSLLRGKFEVSNLALNNASLNLTRDSQGKWDLQELLQRTTQISTAPTSSSHHESRPGFPYIEASHARINFKIGAEKTHFAFTDAQFAFWQQSEDAWGMRLKAQPIRTDANLTDTGIVNVSGFWRRTNAPGLPLIDVAFEWKQAQAGQVSKLLSGTDKGWRGGVLISGTLSGTRKLKLVADTSVDHLGRYDVFNDDDLRLTTHCVADYEFAANSLSEIDCASSAGDGSVELKGESSGLPLTSYRFTLSANKIPPQSVIALLRHTASGVSQDLNVDGVLNTTIEMSRAGSSARPQWSGDGELLDLAVSRGDSSAPLRLDRVPFAIAPDPQTGDAENGPIMQFGPVNVAVGRPSPLQTRGKISLTGYEASVHGDAGLKRLFQIAPMLGIPTPALSADGTSNLDLTISGHWGEKVPTVTGTAQLRNLRAQVRGLNAPLDIRAANLILADDSVRVQNINAAAADTQWSGSMLIPRPCPTPRDCTLQFNLHAAELSATSLNNFFNPAARKQSWYKFLSIGEKPVPYLLQARATGKISVEKLTIASSASSQVSGDVTLDQGKLTIANFRSATLGGKVAGEWRADFLARPPVYRGSGNIEAISLDQVSGLIHDPWVEGTGSARYEFQGAGWNLRELLANSDLSANFSIENARFPHVVLTNKVGPLRVNAFSGKLTLQDGIFSFGNAQLDSRDGIYTVSGTASLAGALKLKMVSEGTFGYEISGTLTRTRVSQIATTSARASLKP